LLAETTLILLDLVLETNDLNLEVITEASVADKVL
jgi:hypothetical protein